GLEYVTYFSPDEKPSHVADLIANYFKTSQTAKLSMRARLNFRWEAIYRQHIVPIL
ncbi:MAG: hypothetical protein JNM46_08390, partial [Anaerolineales bacterium]|nr:hypothetical protein [Anaerolineales bacterium]